MGQRRQGIISLTGEMGRWDWDLWQTERLKDGARAAGTGGQQGDCIVEELLTADEPRWGNGRGRGGLCRGTGRRLSTMS